MYLAYMRDDQENVFIGIGKTNVEAIEVLAERYRKFQRWLVQTGSINSVAYMSADDLDLEFGIRVDKMEIGKGYLLANY